MGSHYTCDKCGLQQCICFVEDLPDQPFYYGKFCIRGPGYIITKGEDTDKLTIYQRFAEKWYDTYEEALSARLLMLTTEKLRMQARLEYLAREILTCQAQLNTVK